MGGTAYAIAGGKGGVGKTTTAINLGVVLAQAGYETVVVDADLAMANLSQRLKLHQDPGIHQVLADETSVHDAIVQGPSGLAVLAGTSTLDAYSRVEPERLRKVVHLLTVAYDVVLLDTGPGINHETVVALAAADGVLLVTEPTAVGVEAVNRTGELAADVSCPPVGATVTRPGDDLDEALAADLDTTLLGTIPEHVTGGPITASRPDGEAAAAYRSLAASLPAVDADAVVPETDGTAVDLTDDAAAETRNATAPDPAAASRDHDDRRSTAEPDGAALDRSDRERAEPVTKRVADTVIGRVARTFGRGERREDGRDRRDADQAAETASESPAGGDGTSETSADTVPAAAVSDPDAEDFEPAPAFEVTDEARVDGDGSAGAEADQAEGTDAAADDADDIELDLETVPSRDPEPVDDLSVEDARTGSERTDRDGPERGQP